MNKRTPKIKNSFDFGIIPRMLLFVLLSNIVTTPIRIFVEAVIEGMEGAPAFVTVPFLIYGVCAEFVVGFGYVIIGYKLPVKNRILRGFAYIMLILMSSYLPNILAMLGGDGKIIEESLTVGIVVVDVISYAMKGLVLGFLMKNYDVKNTSPSRAVSKAVMLLASVINGIVFALLNVITDVIAGALDNSWRLSSILGVSSARETAFYIVFNIFMFLAGVLLTIWFRYCLPEKAGTLGGIVFSLKLSAIVWLPNVLIMAFFGTSFIKTFAYGIAYVIMFVICTLLYGKVIAVAGSRQSKIEHAEAHDMG